MDDFRKSVVRGSEVKPLLMERWLDRFSGTLNQIPNVNDELQDIASANVALNKRMASLDTRQRQVQDAILTRRLKAFSSGTRTGEEIVAGAVKNPRMMRQLTQRLKNDPEALNSLRQHIWDDVVSNDARTMRANISANEKSLTIALGEPHMRNIDTIMQAREMIERVPMPSGKAPTTGPLQNLESQIGMTVPSIMSRVYALQRGVVGGSYLATEMMSRIFRKHSTAEIERLLDIALYDVDVAKALADTIKHPASKPAANILKKHLFNLGLSSREEAFEEDDKESPLTTMMEKSKQ